ncbi:MAG TPA: phospholipase D-like domain-containing protein [Candidatus Acidoferrales bacterium]|nr:phospholipase D-like domain-containing protein [Candidatus Acidoferrales bacterium]
MDMIRNKSKRARHITNALAVFGAGALVFQTWRIALAVGGEPTKYRVDRRRLPPIDSEDFLQYVSALTDSPPQTSRISVLRNGERFYEAELQAIREAKHSINLEAYEFFPGEVTQDVLKALSERAQAGVEVRVVIDAIGSFGTPGSYFDGLRQAGGRMVWYHPVNSKDWPYLNHRSHRKLLVADGQLGFIGGADFADHWLKATKEGPAWRDTVLRVDGGTVSALNAVFAENWLESTGEILAGKDQFQFAPLEAGVQAMIVSSTPHGGTSRARMLYQTLIEAANESIHITTPYFVPDRSARKAILRAAKDRGAEVKILTVGPHSDHAMTRRLSRMFDKPLAAAGAEIYEYQPSMIHAKLMTIDGLWAVAGSTNFDHRSFDLNDEVNILIRDRGLTAQIEEDFARDLEQSRRLTLRSLKHADLADRLVQDASWVLRREE